MKQWTAAKFPKKKILPGLPLYGYVSKSSATTLVDSPARKGSDATLVSEVDVRTNLDSKAAAPGDLSSYFGKQIAFNHVVKLGSLAKSGTAYVAANGYTRGAR